MSLHSMTASEPEDNVRNEQRQGEADEGRRLLSEASPPNLYTEPTMLDAARRAVELAA